MCTKATEADKNETQGTELLTILCSFGTTGETEGIGLELLGQSQTAPVSLAEEEQSLTVEEILSILEQEPDKTVEDILTEYTPAPLAAQTTQKTAEFFTYNERGQLTDYTDGTTTASYTYGADGYRKTKTVNGSTVEHIWDAGLPKSVGKAETFWERGATRE